MSYHYYGSDNSDAFKHVGFTALIGIGAILFYVFVFMNIRLPYLIETRFLSKVGFSVFFSDGSNMSTAFKVALSVAIIGGVIVGVLGYFGGSGELVGAGVAIATVGILVLRLVIALLGYLIWLIFSYVMIILFILAMLGFMIYFIVDEVDGAEARAGTIIFTVFIALISVMLCIIGFRYAAGDTFEDVVIFVIRWFI